MLNFLKILELLFFCSCKNWRPVGGLWDANDDCCERRLEKYMTVRKIHVRVLYTMLRKYVCCMDQIEGLGLNTRY